MDKEIEKVLSLLEKGKINAEEAKALIDAIRNIKDKKEKNDRKSETVKTISGFFKSIFIPEHIYTGNIPHIIDNEDIKGINIKSFGGDINIGTSKDNKIIIENNDELLGKVENKNKIFTLKLFNSELSLLVPESVKELVVHQYGGDINIDTNLENITINSKGGDIMINTTVLNSCKIKNIGGTIKFYVTTNFNATFDIEILSGEFNSQIPFKTIKKSKTHIQGIFNNGDSNIFIKNFGGDVIFKKREDL